MELLGVRGLSVSLAELTRREKTCGVSSSTPLVLSLPLSLPGEHWAADPLLQPGLCSQALAHPEAPSFPSITRESGVTERGVTVPWGLWGSLPGEPLGGASAAGKGLADPRYPTQVAAHREAEWPHRACDVSHGKPDGEQPRPGGHRLQRSLRQGTVLLGEQSPVSRREAQVLATPKVSCLPLKPEPRFLFSPLHVRFFA